MNELTPDSDRTQAATPEQERTTALRSTVALFPDGYEKLEPVGKGGMGIVYRARDKHHDREVAIKLLQDQFEADSEHGHKFIEEARISAQLQHPGIPAIYLVGTMSNQRPFLVMKLIKGRTLDEILNDPTRGPLLGVFEDIAQAIGYAHSHGVIHRDLKPSNVMVGAYGEVQVMDWGLAKVLASGGRQPPDSLTTSTDTHIRSPRSTDSDTQFGQFMGTPAYMPPEQAIGAIDKIDERSDVFGLGGILCIMLTGQPPFVGSSESCRQLAAQGKVQDAFARLDACSAEPEVIALAKRCLSVDPAERPANGNEVARIVAKLRADADERAKQAEIGKARSETRRRVLAWSAAVVFAVLSAGVITGWVLANRARDSQKATADQLIETRKAEAEAIKRGEQAAKARDKTRDVLDAMVSDITGDSLATQKVISGEQKKFLTEVLGFYSELASENADDERSRSRTADAASKVGTIESRLGRKEEAAAAFRMACDGYAALAAEFPAESSYRRNLAGNQGNLGNLLAGLGRWSEAEEQYRQSLAIQQKLVADFPAASEYRRDVARSHNGLGGLFSALGKRSEAEEQYRQSLAIQQKLVVGFPAAPEYRHDVARSHNDLGNLLASLGRWSEAEEQYRKSLAIKGKLAADFPAVHAYRLQLGGSHNNLGALLAALGKRSEAEEEYRQSLAIKGLLAADFPAVPEYRQQLARSHNNLGILLVDVGKRSEAEDQYRKALSLQEKLTTDFPAVPEHRKELATYHNNLGDLLDDLSKRSEAEEQYRKSLTIREKLAADFPTVPEYRQKLAASHNNLGLLLAGLGKRLKAEEHYRLALAIQEKLAAKFPTVPVYRVELGDSCKNYGISISDGGDPAESLKWFGQAIESLQAVYEQEPRNETVKQILRNSHANRAITHDRLQKFVEAMKDWDRAIALSPLAEQASLRASRATSRLNAGMVAEAIAEVAELTKSPKWTFGQWYDFACVYAVASSKLADKKQEYADRAMELLAQAVKAGYKDAAHMKQDTDLDPLRGRADFQKLLADLEAKFPPPREAAPPPRESK